MTQQEAVSQSTDYCLARAEESERMAAEATDEKNKAIFLDLANRWRLLAEEGDSDALKPVGERRRARA
jgi:hypothetical protein